MRLTIEVDDTLNDIYAHIEQAHLLLRTILQQESAVDGHIEVSLQAMYDDFTRMMEMLDNIPTIER